VSGIVALLRTDDAPVDSTLVARLTESLRLRGPEGRHTWCDGAIGLGHALLRTTAESAEEQQPFSLDGRVWIVADGRIDARDALIRALGTECGVSRDAADVELMLRAYEKWGRECVQHLLGDFAFAVWDGPRRQLFCARDHMGVKPFYYARVGRWLLIGSTIEALRLHRDVSGELNDLAITDFLMFGCNQDPATTSFRDIQRLPPAHTLTWSNGAALVERYWTLPIDEPVYYRNKSDYVDEFTDVVRQAVDDRLRLPRVGVFMSGGLDSPMLAATAQRVLQGRAENPVHAFTFVYDSLFPDPEREHAKAIAEHLRISIHYYVRDEAPGWFPEQGGGLPEPYLALRDREPELSCYRDAARHSPVAFYGEGPDNALRYEWRPHLAQLQRARRYARLVADIGNHVVSHKRLPLVPSLPAMLRTSLQTAPEFPSWLEPDVVKRLGLRERWRSNGVDASARHPWRPAGYASMRSARWQYLFERLDPAYTGASLEVRHPFVDIRVLRCMLRVPALPWCRSKHLLRAALRGVLPERERLRAKTPLARDPWHEEMRRSGPPPSRASAAMRTFARDDGSFECVALSHWLHQQEREQHGLETAASA
jgi:asparagine synthase (glutamine-hydrolysing)